jgi:hypothetical protein
MIRREKRARRLLLAGCLPCLIPALAFLFVFSSLGVLVAAIYSAMAPGGYTAGHAPSPEDAAVREHYKQLADTVWCDNKEVPAWNAADLYIVPGEGRYYPAEDHPRLYRLKCNLRQDFDLRTKWGLMHAVNVFRAYNYGLGEITKTQREEVAEALHPHFYYKASTITTTTVCTSTDAQGNTTTTSTTDVDDIYLLVEAHTVYGHYLFEYEWKTFVHSSGGCTTTTEKEVLKNRRQILPDQHQWIKGYLKDLYNLSDDPSAIETARIWMMEAGRGFQDGREHLEWMLGEHGFTAVSGAMVDPVVAPLVAETADRYGLPTWLLNAVILYASGFDTGTPGGLLGIPPKEWADLAGRLGHCPVADRENPRAQLDVGAYILSRKLGGVDWNGDWRSAASALESLYPGRAGAMIEAAKRYRDFSVTWPVPGHTRVSSPFGWRIHPREEWQFHKGIDIPAPAGTPVVSASAGVVTATGWCGRGGGNYVFIEDGLYRYSYLHLSRIDVVRGQRLQPGVPVGLVGATGETTGPHLCFRAWSLAGGRFVDPQGLFQF